MAEGVYGSGSGLPREGVSGSGLAIAEGSSNGFPSRDVSASGIASAEGSNSGLASAEGFSSGFRGVDVSGSAFASAEDFTSGDVLGSAVSSGSVSGSGESGHGSGNSVIFRKTVDMLSAEGSAIRGSQEAAEGSVVFYSGEISGDHSGSGDMSGSGQDKSGSGGLPSQSFSGDKIILVDHSMTYIPLPSPKTEQEFVGGQPEISGFSGIHSGDIISVSDFSGMTSGDVISGSESSGAPRGDIMSGSGFSGVSSGDVNSASGFGAALSGEVMSGSGFSAVSSGDVISGSGLNGVHSDDVINESGFSGSSGSTFMSSGLLYKEDISGDLEEVYATNVSPINTTSTTTSIFTYSLVRQSITDHPTVTEGKTNPLLFIFQVQWSLKLKLWAMLTIACVFLA